MDVLEEVQALQTAPLDKIRERYRELFHEEPRSKHRECLIRRLAWRLQANAYGGLSEQVRRHALEIALDADVRILPPRGAGPFSTRHDRRIPPAGTVLTREYRGRTLSVKVLARGFEYEGHQYRSLSAIATEVTKTRWNGLMFFGLNGKKVRRHARQRS
jgi:hypothetical protein